MTFDWNWFFSSFAQSAAALIGIIGAFIISRLLGLTEKISSCISEFDNLVIHANKVIGGISKRHFYWYTKMNVRYDSDLKKAIQNGEYENLTPEEIVHKVYAADSRLFKVDAAVLEAFNDLYAANKPEQTETKLGRGISMIHKRPLSLDMTPEGLWDRLNEEREAINLIEIEAKSVIEQFGRNLQDLHSFDETIRPLRIIIITLMLAFPITVIYPLHFMPVSINEDPSLTFNLFTIAKSLLSIRFVLLFAFFIAIEGIFFYFLKLTMQLSARLLMAQQNNSEDLRDIKSYSVYFEDTAKKGRS